MAIYFIRLSDFQVERIIACHEHTITAISWNVQNPKQIASIGSDGWIYVWDIERERAESKLHLGGLPIHAEFNPFDGDIVGIVMDTGINSF
jgi:WD40 repeat protein